MINITREEVLRLAKSSRIHLDEHEITRAQSQIAEVLAYAQRVIELSGDLATSISKNVNVMRPDLAVPTDPKPILAQAPDVDENYFVVLPILEK